MKLLNSKLSICLSLLLLSTSSASASASSEMCRGIFGISKVFDVDTDAVKLFNGLKAELRHQEQDAGVKRAFDEKTEALATKLKASKDADSLKLADEALKQLEIIEMLAAEPNLLSNMDSVISLVENGAGKIMHDFTSREISSLENLAKSLMFASRLMDPKAQSTKLIVDTFAESLRLYKPLKSEGTTGTIDTTLQTRFAQMALHFGKTPRVMLGLREWAIEVVKTIIGEKTNDERPLDERPLLDLISLHLESGRDTKSLIEDTKKLIALDSQQKFYFSPTEMIWVMRLAQAKSISLEESAKQIKEIEDGVYEISVKPEGHKNIGVDEFHLSDPHGLNTMLAILTYSNLKPRQIIQLAQSSLNVSVSSKTDYSGPLRATALLARTLLIGSSFNERIRYQIAQILSE